MQNRFHLLPTILLPEKTAADIRRTGRSLQFLIYIPILQRAQAD